MLRKYSNIGTAHLTVEYSTRKVNYVHPFEAQKKVLLLL